VLKGLTWSLGLLALLTVSAVDAGNFQLRVSDGTKCTSADVAAGNFDCTQVGELAANVSGFRWNLQRDTTFAVDPGVPTPNMLAINLHASNHPPAIKNSGLNAGKPLSGNTDASSITVNDVPGNATNKQHYYVSVLPYSGYSLGGAPVLIDKDAPAPSAPVTVVVNKHPIPTAQISIFVFQDNFPVNGAPDLPEESNPPALLPNGAPNPAHVDWSQFTLVLEEAGGKYGQNGGPVLQDAFGNQLGTTYQRGCDLNGQPDADPATNYGCFDATGAPVVLTQGTGSLHPDQNGFLTVRNLAPGKYGVRIVPPTPASGETTGWIQTSTIEGTQVQDAWVKPNEPPFFVEFGPPGPHVFIGFLKSSADYVAGKPGGFPPLPPPLAGQQVATVSGVITDMHMSRPPNFTFFSGRPLPDCWVALNDTSVGLGKGVYAAPCNTTDSSFSIPDVPPGNYQLTVFDANLDAIIAAQPFTVDPTGGTCNAGQSCNLGEVAVFNWFGRIKAGVFSDTNQNGFWDTSEAPVGALSHSVNIRFRDGSIYQGFPTDVEGFANFDEFFPFFNYMVAEVDFGNKKATGATIVVDAGGPVDKTTDLFPGYGELNPQPQCLPVDPVNDPNGPTVGYDPVTDKCPVGTEAINPNTGDNLSRTETGPVLLEAFQAFLGQTNVMLFGKTDYTTFTQPDFTTVPPTLPEYVGENGGITGIVFYAVTRAENDPQFAVGETWEPGVPRVQVALYADGDIDCFPQGDFPASPCDIDWNGNGILDLNDGQIDSLDGVDSDGDGNLYDLADVDNYPLGWKDGGVKGPEDIDRNGNGVFDFGDALQVVYTDSWDDNQPSGCQGQTFVALPGTPQQTATDCFDGLRNFNQVRPGVFDGGYAFDSYDLTKLPPGIAAKLMAFYARPAVAGIGPLVDPLDPAKGHVGFKGLLPADYIVEAATPVGYKLVKEEDKNVDFGDQYIASTQALAASCVGDMRQVPPYFSMLTKDGSGLEAQLIDPANIGDPGAAAPFAGDLRPLCNRKSVPLSAGQNAAADFFVMTDVPIVANAVGIILNDLANEFNPNAPTFGEKAAPAWVPIGFYDWKGHEVNRIHSDQFGTYNAVLPSTWSVNLPQPSGVSPNILTACMNDASPIPNPAYDPATNPDVPQTIIDPFFNPQFSQFCYTLQYMPGSTTYLDTPVVPVAAFASPGQAPVDCERPTLTPEIASVNRRNKDGGGGPFVLPGQSIRIKSMGLVTVPNPEWDGTAATPKTIQRNYRFGGPAGARAELEAADGSRIPLTIDAWNGRRIFATVPATVTPGDYEVVVTRSNGIESPIGVTLTVGTSVGGAEKGVRPNGATYDVWSVPGDFATIQQAIDNVAPGDLILVAPGIYDELVIMWKPVKLQGWGAGEVTINARQVPAEKVVNWRAKVKALEAAGLIDRLPGQVVAPFGFPALAEGTFPTEEGAGIFVVGKRTGRDRFGRLANRGARIDGFSIVGASTGGGIVVNGYAQFLNIGNNRLNANAGFFGGGIRVGHPQISHQIASQQDPDFRPNDPNAQVGMSVYDDATNDHIRIHHNHIAENGGFGGAGGGISLHTGADGYKVQKNWICGNFTQGDGAGIGHLGRSSGGLIEDNVIIFNESFNQQVGTAPSGGGIFIGGQPALAPEAATGLLLSPGSGSVTVDANLIRGNLAGAGDGGGVRVANANGQDVAQNLGDRNPWFVVNLFNNMIDNNVAGVAGGGISLQDSLKVNIRNNTVANNDSTSTGSAAFTIGVPNRSNPLPAGIVSRTHSPDMVTLMTLDVDPLALPSARALQWQTFSDPNLRDDIIHSNRSFFWVNFDNPATPVIETGLFPATCPATPFDPTNPLCDLTLVPVSDYSVDLAVLDGNVVTADRQNPRFSLLTDSTGFHPSNISGDPAFVNGYFNGSRGNTLLFTEFTTLQTAGAFDEGGNFI